MKVDFIEKRRFSNFIYCDNQTILWRIRETVCHYFTKEGEYIALHEQNIHSGVPSVEDAIVSVMRTGVQYNNICSCNEKRREEKKDNMQATSKGCST